MTNLGLNSGQLDSKINALSAYQIITYIYKLNLYPVQKALHMVLAFYLGLLNVL